MAADVTSLKFDAKLSIFELNDGSQLRDISPYIANIDFGNKFKVNDVTTYGSLGTRPSLSLDDSDFTIDLVWNQVTTTGVQTVVGAMYAAKATRAFAYYPAGKTAGNTKLSGNCMCSDFPFSGKVEDAVRTKAKFLVDNAVTFGVAT